MLSACSFNLFHAPFFTEAYGTSPAAERAKTPDSPFIQNLAQSIRSFDQVCAYPPNQSFIGNLDPRQLPPRPWHSLEQPGGSSGPFGDIIDEQMIFGLIKFSDVFNLVKLEKDFSQACKDALGKHPVTSGWDLSSFDKANEAEEIRQDVSTGAVALTYQGAEVGCVVDAHPTDENLKAHTIFENLVSKATAVYAVNQMFFRTGIDPATVDYIIETSEEACGDINQRGGGNFAKAIGELCGLVRATGSDTRSFCAAPVHGIVQAASLVQAGTFSRVVVTAGGTTAKLAMNAKKHVEKGLPVLEDCMGSFALLIERESTTSTGIILRTDAVGIHRIGSGSSPQAVVNDLAAEPVYKAGYRLTDVDYYAPELQNSEITEQAGAGSVTESNLKMIAAMAVMKQEIERSGIADFIAAHGSPGWAPTQGHIPSGVPALGWLLKWMEAGLMKRALVIGKGSLFLGRMTSLFDGISILVEGRSKEADREVSGKTRIALTIPGSEGGAGELHEGARLAQQTDAEVDVVCFGTAESDAQQAHREMEDALRSGNAQAAVTFHYNFPIGVATVGHFKAPGNGRDLFLATTTGTTSASRVESLVKNVISGISAAKAYGIAEPQVGFINSEGAATARKIILQLKQQGYSVNLAQSVRGDELLRGNDILAGSIDVAVCDSLTGNVITKLLGSYESSGVIESSGSGYGPGIGDIREVVCIVSRASGAPVIRDALLLAKRMVSGSILEVYRRELASARSAGLDELLREHAGRVKPAPAGSGSASGNRKRPQQKVTDSEIEGVDVLVIEEAVSALMDAQIYCTAGMGCTGPVIMVAREDKKQAQEILRSNGYL